MSYHLNKHFLADVALILAISPAMANPNGAQVAAGAATVQGQGTPTLTVTQSTDKAIINWRQFDIGAGDTTRFIQPRASSVVLNRVTGGLGASQIYGALTANGRVFLVNPDGILFGPSAKIDAAGFLATTHDIRNDDFMAGRYVFGTPGRPDASIVNQGTITARDSGFAALVAPGVRNAGTIIATLGNIGLTAGNGFTLDFYGDRLITLFVGDAIAGAVRDVATGQPLSALVKNDGILKANGGQIALSASAARQIIDSVINNTGVIEANTVGLQGGTITLAAATTTTKPAGTAAQAIKISGTLSAAGNMEGTKGGKIEVTGEAIELAGAHLDASGQSGGGTVLVGGDVSGGQPSTAIAQIPRARLESYSVPSATTVTVDTATTIDASAKNNGEGGKVVVWADQSTNFDGTISARGGAISGDGGFVETSGHQQLAFNGVVDVSAPNGQRGTLLLDPLNATIQTNSGDGVITVAAVQNALASGDVLVSTGSTGAEAGDITVASSINWSNASFLWLSAFRNITINNARIANSGAGNLILQSDSTGTGAGTVNFSNAAQVDFSASTGIVSIVYNPPFGYVFPLNYAPFVRTNGAVSNQFTAYMLVNNVDNLQAIQQNLSGNYVLGKDIDASATATWNSGAGFVPLGDATTKFTGIFDGQSHVVDSLTINSRLEYVGLFGSIDRPGVVRDIGLTNINVTGFFFSPCCTFGKVGSLAGNNQGIISQAYATGSVTGNSPGGLVGTNNSIGAVNSGIIFQSYSDVVVTGNSGAGGFVHGNFGSIIQSYARGAVTASGNSIASSGTGGFVGVGTNGVIAESYSTGGVTGATLTTHPGGLIGTLGGACLNSGCTVVSSYWDIQSSGQSNSGGGTGLTTANLKAGLPSGFNSSVWAISANVNSGYPYLQWQTASTSSLSPTTLQPSSGSGSGSGASSSGSGSGSTSTLSQSTLATGTTVNTTQQVANLSQPIKTTTTAIEDEAKARAIVEDAIRQDREYETRIEQREIELATARAEGIIVIMDEIDLAAIKLVASLSFMGVGAGATAAAEGSNTVILGKAVTKLALIWFKKGLEKAGIIPEEATQPVIVRAILPFLGPWELIFRVTPGQ